VTDPLPLNVSRRHCRDCRSVLVGPSVYRCADCVLKRIELLSKKEDM
jgi:hypothetical protein